MRKDDCFLLGYVIKPHGLKGEVSVFLDTDSPDSYDEMESVLLEINQRLIPFFISELSLRGDRAILRLEGVDTFEQAEELRGAPMYLPEDLLPELESGQFYFHEVIGFEVSDKEAGDIGQITRVYASGKQDLLAVDHHGTEVLIPVIDEIILRVDREDRKIHVVLPEGLLDIYR